MWVIKKLKQFIKNGISESDILENKRLHCEPDRIRRVLLAIERFEAKQHISREHAAQELLKIRTSVNKICYSLTGEYDVGFFASSIINGAFLFTTNFYTFLQKRYNQKLKSICVLMLS